MVVDLSSSVAGDRVVLVGRVSAAARLKCGSSSLLHPIRTRRVGELQVFYQWVTCHSPGGDW